VVLEFAQIWRDKPKIVFSRTLSHVEWNSRLVRDDVVGEVARLRAQPGFDMGVGGPTLAASLMQAGLIDEYRLFVHPVILGAGNPYFPALEDRIGLRLLETRTFGSGVIYLRYAPVSKAVPI
jgi:dihydrofolate reductase